jgi:hypothetical protein
MQMTKNGLTQATKISPNASLFKSPSIGQQKGLLNKTSGNLESMVPLQSVSDVSNSKGEIK